MKVPCGYCPACLSNKRNEWSIRLNEEMRISESAYFLTLTYDDDHIKYKHKQGQKTYTFIQLMKLAKKESIAGVDIETLDKFDLQNFNKRLRKFQSEHTETKIRFYAVGEYGTETQRPHYHGIYFNLSKTTAENIEKIWKNGQIMAVVATPASIHYVTKYVINKTSQEYEKQGKHPPFALMSRNKGIGYNYVKRTKDYHKQTQNAFHTNGDITTNLPKYYKDKIFTEEEKKKIAEKNMELAAIKSGKKEPPLKHETEDQRKQIYLSINKRIKKGKL